MDNVREGLIDYYFLFRRLVDMHRSLGYGTAPRLSEGFTERLCGYLYNLEKPLDVGREYDLYDPISRNKIEVKATSDDYGSTTINPHAKFDLLYWVNFRLDLNCLWIRKIEYQKLIENLKFNVKDKRVNCILSKFELTQPVDFFKICEAERSILKMTVEQQLAHIRKI
jgi:hypothetical protein